MNDVIYKTKKLTGFCLAAGFPKSGEVFVNLGSVNIFN